MGGGIRQGRRSIRAEVPNKDVERDTGRAPPGTRTLRLVSLLLIVVGVIAASFSATAGAKEPLRIGMVASVKQKVVGRVPTRPERRIVEGDDVFLNEKIVTAGDAGAIIQFRDRSTLELGPNSTVVLGRSVFNPLESVSQKSINIVAGTFRFVSGVASRSSETDLRTPAGTLGIRGSIVLGKVDAYGGAVLFPVQGQASFAGGAVLSIAQGGSVIAASFYGTPLALPNIPPALGVIFQDIINQLGPGSLVVRAFSSSQSQWNAGEHLVPWSQQAGEQGSDGGPPSPLSLGISGFVAVLQQLQGGANGQADGLTEIIGLQLAIHDANVIRGTSDVIAELATVLSADQVEQFAATLIGVYSVFASSAPLDDTSLSGVHYADTGLLEFFGTQPLDPTRPTTPLPANQAPLPIPVVLDPAIPMIIEILPLVTKSIVQASTAWMGGDPKEFREELVELRGELQGLRGLRRAPGELREELREVRDLRELRRLLHGLHRRDIDDCPPVDVSRGSFYSPTRPTGFAGGLRSALGGSLRGFR